jgi:hypothetical protein
MAHSVTVSGVVGSLKWSYHEAATVTAWTVTRAGDAWHLTATIGTSDPSRVSQRPLRFVAPHATGAWRWPIQELQISGASLTAVLGPPER